MGSSSPSTVTQTNKVELSPEQKEIFGLAMPKIREYASSNPQLFGGSGVVGFNTNEQAGQASALDAAGKMGGLTSQLAGTQSKLLDPEFMLKPNQYVNDAAGAVTRQTTQNLMENILPGIRSGATSAGGQYSGGSTRQGIAESKAITGTNRELSDSLAKMYLSNYTTGLQGMQKATTDNANVLQQMLFPSNVQSAVGAQQRGMEQAKKDEEISKFYTQQDLPLLQANQIMGLVSGMPGATGVSTVQGAQPKPSGLQQALGIGMTIAGLASGNPMMAMQGMGSSGMAGK